MRSPFLCTIALVIACRTSDEPVPASDAVELELPSPWRMLDIDDDDARLRATALDAEGQPVEAPIVWTADDPEVLQIDADGTLRPQRIGSTMVTASMVTASTGTIEARAFVYVARPAAGTHLVTDDQIIGELHGITDVDPERLDGLTYWATLDASLSLQAGDRVVGVESGLPASTVVSVETTDQGLHVELALASADEVFDDLAIHDESVLAAVANEEGSSNGAREGVEVPVGKQVFERAGMECKLGGNVAGDLLEVLETDFDVDFSIDNLLDFEIEDGSIVRAEALVRGELGVQASVDARIAQDYTVKVECSATDPRYWSRPLPPALGGPLLHGYVLLSAGVGAEAKAESYGPHFGFDFEGTASFTAGLRYAEGELEDPNDVDADLDFSTHYDHPENSARLVTSVHPTINIGMGPGLAPGVDLSELVSSVAEIPSPPVLTLAEAKIGPKVSLDLAHPVHQVSTPDYRSTFGVGLEMSVGPAGPDGDDDAETRQQKALSWFLGAVAANVNDALTFKHEFPLWETPDGTLELSGVPTRVGDTVEGTVTLEGPAGYSTPLGDVMVIDDVSVHAFDGSELSELVSIPPTEVEQRRYEFSTPLGADDDPQTAYVAFAKVPLLDTPLELEGVDLRCSMLRLVVDELILPPDAPGDGVDADEAVLAQYDTIIVLYDYYSAQRDYWLSMYNLYTSLGDWVSAANAYSLWELYNVQALNLANESVGQASFYAALAGADDALMRLTGGNVLDDVEATGATFTEGFLEAGWIEDDASPQWDEFPATSAEHTFTYAPVLDDIYPFVAMLEWRLARRLPGNEVYLSARGFEGVAAYATDATIRFTWDGEPYAAGTTEQLPSQTAERTLTLGTPVTLRVDFEGRGYDRDALPSLEQTGTVSGTVLSMRFHLEVEPGTCP